MYLCCSACGVVVNPLFFTWCLFDWIVYVPTMHIVLRSVVDNVDVLVKTCILTSLVLYVYTLWGMIAFKDAFGDKCDTFLSCFVFHFNFGLRSGGGIGDVIDAQEVGCWV